MDRSEMKSFVTASFSELALKATKEQLQSYPESTLTDIYKSFFQDEFGPGHLLDDPVSAKAYFEHELSIMKSKGRYDDEPCGVGRRFHRTHMDAIVDGKVDAERFFAAFLAGAAEFSLPEIGNWIEKWDLVLESIDSLRPAISGFSQDAIEISDALRQGRYVIHHSERYSSLYDPHYRIMRNIDVL